MSFVPSGVSVVIITTLHPLGYAKVLIQLGNEPVPPYLAKSPFWRKPQYYYPNVFQYIRHIKRKDGFLGLYRGLVPRILEGIVGSYVTQSVTEYVKKKYPIDENEEGPEVVIFFKHFALQSSQEVAAKTLAIIASQPLQVIALRTMAQFVGQETLYRNIFVSVMEIYENEGILGFYAGIIPRLIGDALAIVLINLISDFVNRYFITEKEYKAYTAAVSSLFVTQFTYPFELVSRNMSVKPARLLAAQNMPDYTDWLDCWRMLKQNGDLHRGSKMFLRAAKKATLE
ncbi:mitochondrial carrier homolog 2-like [Saccostrea echinata]|uniref:mitochondrial carrier homolog 2-like n=1 Tax=Saccostrea echinata TaxID=191078 RepID=UPI002A81E037|nr:mitochondrial carrier homolog 2-like [Saccostrea echinata]